MPPKRLQPTRAANPAKMRATPPAVPNRSNTEEVNSPKHSANVKNRNREPADSAMVWIKGASFTMGSDDEHSRRSVSSNEWTRESASSWWQQNFNGPESAAS